MIEYIVDSVLHAAIGLPILAILVLIVWFVGSAISWSVDDWGRNRERKRLYKEFYALYKGEK